MFEFFDDQDEHLQRNASSAPGKVRFDDRGNAIYAWNDRQLEQDNERAEKMREQALENPTLALIDDSPDLDSTSIRNAKGLRLGYNPYQSGQLGAKSATKKHNLRELSKWIEQQRRLGLLNPAVDLKK